MALRSLDLKPAGSDKNENEKQKEKEETETERTGRPNKCAHMQTRCESGKPHLREATRGDSA